jgi:hypothetical protein
MPLIFKTLLKLLGLAAAGRALSTYPDKVYNSSNPQANSLGFPPPWSPEFALANSVYYAFTKDIEDRIQLSGHKYGYYLDRTTFYVLEEYIADEDAPDDKYDTYCLHYAAYLNLSEDLSLKLPRLLPKIIDKYHAIKARIQFDPDSHPNQLAIAMIQRKVQETQLVGNPPVDEFFRKNYNKITRRDEKAYLDHVLIAYYRCAFYQDDIKILYNVLVQEQDTIPTQRKNEAQLVKQFYAYSIKSHVLDQGNLFSHSTLHHDLEAGQFEKALKSSDLTLEELLLVMNEPMPKLLMVQYGHYVVRALMNSIYKKNKDATDDEIERELSRYFSSLPYSHMATVYDECLNIYREILKGTAQSYIWGYRTSHFLGFSMFAAFIFFGLVHKFAQGKLDAWERERQFQREQKILQRNAELELQKNEERDRQRHAEIQRQKMHEQEALRARQAKEAALERANQVRKNALEKIKENEKKKKDLRDRNFVKLVWVGADNKRIHKIYEDKIKIFQNNPDEWFASSDEAKLFEFMGQLKLAFKGLKNASSLENNEAEAILDKLTKAHEKLSDAVEKPWKNNKPNDQEEQATDDMMRILADAYFDLTQKISEQAPATTVAVTPVSVAPASASSASSSLQKVVVSREYDNFLKNITIYLNDANEIENNQIKFHAYKLLIIKFYTTITLDIVGANLYNYLTQLRNALTHNHIPNTQDSTDKLFAILISLEMLKNSEPATVFATLNADTDPLLCVNQSTYALYSLLPDAKAKVSDLLLLLPEIYEYCVQHKDNLIPELVLTDVLAQMLEVLVHSPCKQEVAAIRDFRNQIYHNGHLKHDMNLVKAALHELQNKYYRPQSSSSSQSSKNDASQYTL